MGLLRNLRHACATKEIDRLDARALREVRSRAVRQIAANTERRVAQPRKLGEVRSSLVRQVLVEREAHGLERLCAYVGSNSTI